MKVLAVIEALPGVGKVKARRTMEEIGIADTRRVRGLGEQQQKALLEAFRCPRLIVVISGPGGVGKGTLVARFLERNPRFWLSRSWTTPRAAPRRARRRLRVRRPPRSSRRGSTPTASSSGRRSSTTGRAPPSCPTTPAADVLLEIDTQGAAQIKALHPDAVLIFVDAPSRDEQRRRLEGRGETPERIQRAPGAGRRRGRAGPGSRACTSSTNDDLEQAVRDVEALAGSRHANPDRTGQDSRPRGCPLLASTVPSTSEQDLPWRRATTR